MRAARIHTVGLQTDYDIDSPRFGPVNVGDDGTIEFRLVFVHA
jgi:hypothetical protein